MEKLRRICLVSPSHVAANPRLVKEADALHAAGYSVHVVAGWYFPPLDALDREIYEAARWQRSIVFYLTGPRVLFQKYLRNWARRRLAGTTHPSLALARRASHAATSLLAKAAASVPADLYIGHTVAGLAAAAEAARRTESRYSFDAEDFHDAETDAHGTGTPEFLATRTIQAKLLPHSAHLTAASPLIGRAYVDTYKVPLPIPVLNVFPLTEAPSEPHPGSRPDARPQLYWFSQTIGPGRGLEKLLAIVSRMTTVCDLYFRGLPAPEFVQHLRRLAAHGKFRGKIEVLPPASSQEMARLSASYDLGLSLEQQTPLNRDLCLTNKIFTYLLAGIPVGFTPTTAQTQLASELGDASLLLPFEDADRCAATLDAFFANPQRRANARAAAWRLGQSRFNWDFEQKKLLACVETVFEKPSSSIEGDRHSAARS